MSSHNTTYRIESVVYNVLDVFAHSNLSHQLVLVSIHSSQLTNMSEDVLQPISKLEELKKILILHHKLASWRGG